MTRWAGTVAAFVVAAATWSFGVGQGFYIDVEDVCGGRALGSPGFEESVFPVHERCRWADGSTTDLVPWWVNPLLFLCMVLLVVQVVRAIHAIVRAVRPGNRPHGPAGPTLSDPARSAFGRTAAAGLATAPGLAARPASLAADSVTSPGDEVVPFRPEVGQDRLDDLRARLRGTRWPDRETAGGWVEGAPLDQVRALCDYWRDGYDWRRCEAGLDSRGQFRTRIDGLGLHLLHVRSPEPDALPMVLTHGWPGSVVEFIKVLGPLSDPVAHGGSARDAFHLLVPSLPGYGFPSG